MTRTTRIPILTLALLAAIAVATPPAAADWFSLGGSFRIGGLHFSLALGHPGPQFPLGYYYRTLDPLSYRNVRCSSYCFHRGAYDYHHESCPVVRHHLDRYEIDPYDLFARYAPRDDRYRRGRDGYDRYDGYGRNDRYDRYDRYPYPDERHRYSERSRDRWRDRRDDHRRYRERGDESCPLNREPYQ